MESFWLVLTLKVIAVLALAAFLPFTARSYYHFRHRQRQGEIIRIFEKLKISSKYEKIYSAEIRSRHFALAVGFATIISIIGLTVLLLGNELEIPKFPNLPMGGVLLKGTDIGNTYAEESLVTYQQGALLVFGMAFIGAYLWGLQNIFRRYCMNDLSPSAYYGLALRMIFAAMIALVIYHGAKTLPILLNPSSQTDGLNETAGKTAGILPAIAFIIGMFPQRGVNWITSRLSFLSQESHPSVQDLPLEMIEGVDVHDRIRLTELGVDNCYDLAAADFIPLLIKTPYNARELIDWILQAKLCVKFGQGIKDLREHGLRTIVDLKDLDDTTIEELSKETQLRLSSLTRATKSVEKDHNINRLQKAAQILSEYWEGETEIEALPDKPRISMA
jgi:hypothetical protein